MSPNIIVIKSGRMRWEGHATRMGAMRNEYKSLVGEPEEIRSPWRTRCRWGI